MSLNSLCDKTIVIQKMSTGTADGMGGYSAAGFSDWVTGVKARIQPLSGEEQLLFDQQNIRVTTRIYLEPITSSDITHSNRVRYGSRYYNIHIVRDIDEQDRLITLECEEIDS